MRPLSSTAQPGQPVVCLAPGAPTARGPCKREQGVEVCEALGPLASPLCPTGPGFWAGSCSPLPVSWVVGGMRWEGSQLK